MKGGFQEMAWLFNHLFANNNSFLAGQQAGHLQHMFVPLEASHTPRPFWEGGRGEEKFASSFPTHWTDGGRVGEWFGFLSKWLSPSRMVFSPVCEKAWDWHLCCREHPLPCCSRHCGICWTLQIKKITTCILKRCNHLSCPEGSGRNC